MDELLKKLDNIMTSDLVRKVGGLFCFLILVLSIIAFFIGAGTIMKSMKKPEAATAVEGEAGAGEEEAIEEEAEEEVSETEEEESQ